MIYLDVGPKETNREIQVLEDATETGASLEFVTPGLNNGLVEVYKS